MVYIIGETVDLGRDGKSIIDNLKDDRRNFQLNGDKLGISACQVILGEIQRDPNKDYSDKNATAILRKLRTMTMKNPEPDFFIIELINTYIPPPVSDVEVKKWMESSGYTSDAIASMGRGAYRIIGEAKNHFEGRDINADVVKNIIDTVLNN